MKRFFGIMCAVTAALACVGCATSKAAFAPASVSPIAVMAVSANSEITWYGEEGTKGAAVGLLNKAIKDNANADVQKLLSRTAPFIETADKALYEVLAKKTGLTFIDKKATLGSAAYTAAKENKLLAMGNFEKPEGYKYFANSDKAAAKAVKAETGAASLMYVVYKIEKTVVNGVRKTGNMTACVSVSVVIADENGKVLLNKTGYASNKDNKTLPVVAGVYDPRALAEMYPATITAALENLVSKL